MSVYLTVVFSNKMMKGLLIVFSVSVRLSVFVFTSSDSETAGSVTAVKIVCGSIFRFLLAINTQCTVIDMQIILNDILHDL